jgi:hypothetical protein
MLIYLDTNVYARPFDDQTQPDIQQEANAFLMIIRQIELSKLALLCSDILSFEVSNIIDVEKRAQVQSYSTLCSHNIGSSEHVLSVGKTLQRECDIRGRDALHVASAILGGARYFLSCDKKIVQMKQLRCYRHIGRGFRKEYFSAMNPVLFVEKLGKGELA